MIDIVKWCAQQHVNGADDYCEKLSHTYGYGRSLILIQEKVTKIQKERYSKEKVNGWYIFKNLHNQAKKEMIDKILRACIRQDGTSPILDQDLQVKMPNC